MSTNDRKAKAQAAAKGASGGANVIVVAGIVVVLAMALIIGGVIWASRDTGSAGGASQLPDGVSKGQPIEPFAAAEPADDVPVVDVYEDFRCPYCQVLEQALGNTLSQLAADGSIRLRVHLKTVIDSRTGGDSSAVAGSSAVCAADQGVWDEYHSALFDMQPSQETREGFTKGDYVKAAEDAGLYGDAFRAWQSCTDKGVYVDYVKSVDDATAANGITGTPVIELNGEQFDWTGLVDLDTRRGDTARAKKILTSGEIPNEFLSQ